ncbi:MAG: DoxX family protein [Bacteroidales bacterium]|nr:DoxX family protein [Bacteroidales bacterium]
MTKKTKSLLLTITVNASRLLLAATFMFSGFIKANDPMGTTYKLEDYVSAMLWFRLPDTFLLGCSVILALVEFTLGVYILFGIKRNTTSRITVGFMSLMTLLTVYIAIANPVEDCGCFGDVLVLSNIGTLAKNIVLLALAILVCKNYSLQKNFVSSSIKWLIAIVTLCSIVGYSIYCIICLPVLDFRPYSVGTDMRAVLDSTSSQKKFDIKIIYEKDGKTLELSVEDTDPDSSWKYVETRRIPVETSHLATANFYVTDANDEDMTEDILYADGYTFLLVIPNLMKADEGCIDRVNEIYDYTREHNTAFYCLTASADERAQIYWNDHTGAEYGYYIAEERMLKTVVRGNPGLVLLKDGVIIKKWSNYNLPNEDDLQDWSKKAEEEKNKAHLHKKINKSEELSTKHKV